MKESNLDTIYRDKASARVPGPCGLTTMLPRCCSAALALILMCVLTVTDAAAQTVTLSLSPTMTEEDAGSEDIAVTATLSAMRTSATTITLTLGGTAVGGAGKDYTTPAPLPTITIPANTMTGNTNLSVSPVDDTIYEGDETITVTGSAGGLTVTGADLTLQDDETRPQIRLRADLGVPQAIIHFSENGGTQYVTIYAILQGDATLPQDTEITFTLTREGTLFTAPDPLPVLTIRAGETTGNVSLSITPINNNVYTAEFRRNFRLSGAANDHRGDPFDMVHPHGAPDDHASFDGYMIFEIDDDEPAPSPTGIFVSVEPNTIYEDDPATTVTLTVYVVGAPVTADVTFQVTIPRGLRITNNIQITPSDNQDITIMSGTNSATTTLTLTPVNDMAVEEPLGMLFGVSGEPEGFIGREGSSPNFYLYDSQEIPAAIARLFLIGFEPFLTHRIISPWIHFNKPFYTTGSRPTLTLNIGGEERTAQCNTATSVNALLICGYRVARGDSDLDGIEITSANALDFTDVNIFDSRTNMALSVDATIPSEYVTIYPQIIVHGGAKSFQLLLDRESLQEGLGATQLRVTATLRVGSLPQDDIQIPIVFTNSTTTSADYTVSGTQAITISANQTSGSTMLTFTPVEDYIKEQRTETVQIAGGMSDFFVLGTELEVIDAPSIALSVDDMSITEGGGAQAVVVTAALGDASDQVRPRPIPVTLSLFGSAGGGDYTVAEPQLLVTIPANARSSTTTLTFTPVDDLLLEGDETIVLRGTTPGLTVEGTELVLEDNDEDAGGQADHRRQHDCGERWGNAGDGDGRTGSVGDREQ